MSDEGTSGSVPHAGHRRMGEPDAQTAPASPEPARESDRQFPCPACGAILRFDPGAGDLVCDHCGHHEPFAGERPRPAPLPELPFREGLDAALPGAETEEVRLARCQGCGAEIVFDPTSHATTCPYCASPVVADPGAVRRLRPQGVAPFAVTEAQARAAMQGWLKGLWFAPSALRGQGGGGRALEGVYMPYWTFDAKTRTRYTGQRGTTYYVTEPVTVRDQQGNMRTELRQVPRIAWTPASGQVARSFDDVLVLASRALPQSHTEALLPWDLTALRPYRPEYLAGFRSEVYTETPDEGMGEARAYMGAMIERDVRFDIGGDQQQVGSVDTDVSDVTFKHVLLPVWSAAYRFGGRSYRFVVNGQTGKVEGERPWSWVKIALTFLALALLIGGGVWLMQTYGQPAYY